MQLFYLPEISTELVSLDKEESYHLAKVLRKKAGDIIFITDGLGNMYQAEILSPDQVESTVKIVATLRNYNARNYSLHIAIAPTKNIDRFEWFLEKATEVGIDTITPIITSRTERTIIKQERLEKLILSALKQSNQALLPKLNPLITLKSFLEIPRTSSCFIAHCEDGKEKKPLIKYIKECSDILVLIGPEGDFTTAEIEMALANNYKPVSLGNTRLRTETAGLYTCISASACRL